MPPNFTNLCIFFGGGGQEVEKSVKEKQAKSGEKTTFSRSPFVWLVPSN